MIQNDYQLIEKARSGDMSAFEQLIYKYDRNVLNIAASFRNNEDDAKDIYQEVFIRVYKGLKKFQFKSEFSTWLYRITTNVCISYQRTQKRHAHESLDKEIQTGDDDVTTIGDFITSDDRTDERTISSELSKNINNALELLPAQQKLAFTLKYYQGFKIREIADMMNCTEGTVKRYLFTATNKMRYALKDKLEY